MVEANTERTSNLGAIASDVSSGAISALGARLTLRLGTTFACGTSTTRSAMKPHDIAEGTTHV